jgi:endonuclease YncB( thermonuclease family)
VSIGHRPTGLARAVTLAALLLASQSLIVSAAEAGQTISGLAYVIDGDTISINGQHIRAGSCEPAPPSVRP